MSHPKSSLLDLEFLPGLGTLPDGTVTLVCKFRGDTNGSEAFLISCISLTDLIIFVC
jgi:hypothetical protein